MKIGQSVKVFSDPMTQTKLEGIGIITAVYPGDYDRETKLHLVKVKFSDIDPKLADAKALLEETLEVISAVRAKNIVTE